MTDYGLLLRQALEAQDPLEEWGSPFVLKTSSESLVVKVYRSQHDYDLIKAMQGDPHFPTIICEMPYPDQPEWPAVLMERLATWGPVTAEIADIVQRGGRHWISSLRVAAHAISEKQTKTPYPVSLAHSLEKLYRYLGERGPEFQTDLNQPSNWGVRGDGTVVMLDPLYYCT